VTGRIPRKERNRTTYTVYIKKAEQFFSAMESSLVKKQFDSTALEGIHCIISTIDALLIYRGSIVSASAKHEDAVKLLTEIWDLEDVNEAAKHAFRVLKLKTDVEYTDYQVTEKQAQELHKHTQRFFVWAKTKLPK